MRVPRLVHCIMAEKLISEATRERIRQAWPDILSDLAGGKLVRDTLVAHLVTPEQKRVYVTTEPNARAQWDEAREASADAFFDEAIEVIHSPEAKTNPNYARVVIDTLKWASRIRNSRQYGDKVQLDVRTLDLTRVIADANARLARGRTLTGESSRVDDDARALADIR